MEIRTHDDYVSEIAALAAAARAYYSGTGDTLDDTDYDERVRALAAIEATHPDWVGPDGGYASRIAGGAAPGGDITHAQASLSLANAFSLEDLTGFEAAALRLLGTPRVTGGWVVEPKLDGLACLLTIRNGQIVTLATRGDGQTGEDVTHALAYIGGLPQSFPTGANLELRGEVVMHRTEMERANQHRLDAGHTPYANPRNAAAGALRARDHAVPVTLEFYAYAAVDLDQSTTLLTMGHQDVISYLASMGVRTAASTLSTHGQPVHADTIEQAHAALTDAADHRDGFDFDIDGFVIKADSASVRQALGNTSHSPRWAIAYKLPAETRLTTVESIDIQVGRTGRITPVAKVAPVQVGGVTVTSVTLHNYAHIARLDLRAGDRVWVRRAGEVIPEIVSVDHSSRPDDATAVVIPDACPRCGDDLDRSEQVWRCARGRACGTAEAILFWASRDCMDVDGLGPGAVAALIDAGLVRDVPDLYLLEQHAVAALPGWGSTSAEALLTALQSARHQPLDRFIAALGIRMMGRRMARRIADRFGTLAAVRSATVAELAAIDGIGDVKAQALHDGLREAGPLMDELLTVGVVPPDAAPASPGSGAAGPLSGKRVCVTGSIDGHTRQSAEERVRELGGTPVSSVSSTTDLLICGVGGGSKAAKAAKLGVATWPAEQFLAL